jgi:hypothetical protein
MIVLSDYFAPLNFEMLSYFVLLFLFFDILGTFVKRIILGKNDNDKSRIINWLIGYGFFIFIWFIASLFIAYKREPVLVSIVALTAVSLPYYIKIQGYKSLLGEFWRLKVPILIISGFLPAVFIKASLPPYYADEMAYHFISPFTLSVLDKINYTGGLYADSPRLQNLFYEISFSLTHTYSVARLFHFTILATSMLYAFGILRKNFGLFAGFLFVFIFYSLPQDIVLTSTLGYVDVAAYSFLLIGIISATDFFINKKESSLVLAVLFWAMNLGTKYTGVTSFVVFILTFTGVSIIFKRDLLKVFNKKMLIRLIIVFGMFGGYWYIKNLIIYGNPIYPFIFPCRGEYAVDCQTGGSFFGTWTMKVTFSNAYKILSLLFNKNIFLRIAVLLVPVLAFLGRSKKIRLLTVLLVTPVLLELLILKYFSGFYIRYHQHMQLYLMIALVIQFSYAFPTKDRRNLSKLILTGVIITCLSTYLYTIKYVNSLKFLNFYEIGYATGSVSIYDWTRWKFPTMDYTLRWCEEPPIENVKSFARFDPDLTWFDYEGKVRVFLTNCKYVNPPLHGVDVDKVIKVAKEKELKFLISSTSKCQSYDEMVGDRKSYEDDYKFYLRELNNEIVCNSEEKIPYLFYFDYEKVPSADKL